MSATADLLEYIQLGFTHVIPLGFDHILFILCLFFHCTNLKSIVLQCSIFTIAHSLSLGSASYGLVMPNEHVVEPLIALSILFTAIENMVSTKINTSRLVLIFAFGLIHGLGFAAALKDIGIPKEQFLATMVAFNIGVEIGQFVVILVAYLLVSKWFAAKTWYKDRIVYPISSAIACIALYWFIERIIG